MKDNLSLELIDAMPVPFHFAQLHAQPWEIAFAPSEEETAEGTYFPAGDEMYALNEAFVIPRDIRSQLVRSTIVNASGFLYLTPAMIAAGDGTWGLCESFINLGYYPPVSLASKLPIAGKMHSKRECYVAGVCGDSLDAMIQRCQSAKQRLRKMEWWYWRL